MLYINYGFTGLQVYHTYLNKTVCGIPAKSRMLMLGYFIIMRPVMFLI